MPSCPLSLSAHSRSEFAPSPPASVWKTIFDIPTDEVVGEAKWLGPGSFTLAPKHQCLAECKTEKLSSMSTDILFAKAPEMPSFPAGVQLLVLPASELNVSNQSYTSASMDSQTSSK